MHIILAPSEQAKNNFKDDVGFITQFQAWPEKIADDCLCTTVLSPFFPWSSKGSAQAHSQRIPKTYLKLLCSQPGAMVSECLHLNFKDRLHPHFFYLKLLCLKDTGLLGDPETLGLFIEHGHTEPES